MELLVESLVKILNWLAVVVDFGARASFHNKFSRDLRLKLLNILLAKKW